MRTGAAGPRRGLWVSAVGLVLVIGLAVGVRGWRAGHDEAPDAGGTQSRDLARLQGGWALSELTVGGDEKAVGEHEAIDLNLGRTSVDGWTGCQGYATVYTASAWGAFTTDPLGLTEDACSGEDAAFAKSYLDAFSAAARWTITDDGALQLRGAGVTLVYSRRSEPGPPTEGTASPTWMGTWRVMEIHTPARVFETGGDDEYLWIGIGEQRVTGHGGCNAFLGQVSSMGARGLFFDQLVIGLKSCRESGDIMPQETDLMSVLAGVDRWDVGEDETLVLTGHDISVTLQRVGEAPDVDSVPPI
jgi:heat shock protein HslJ